MKNIIADIEKQMDLSTSGLSDAQLRLQAAILSLPTVEMVEIDDNVFEIVPGQSGVILRW